MVFRDLPIRRKLGLLVLSSTGLALILACTGLAVYERIRFREAVVSELTTLADTLGANSAASLAFNDQKTAQEMLSALLAESTSSPPVCTMRTETFLLNIAVPTFLPVSACQHGVRQDMNTGANR